MTLLRAGSHQPPIALTWAVPMNSPKYHHQRRCEIHLVVMIPYSYLFGNPVVIASEHRRLAPLKWKVKRGERTEQFSSNNRFQRKHVTRVDTCAFGSINHVSEVLIYGVYFGASWRRLFACAEKRTFRPSSVRS